jgi:hypothetical protein
MWFFVVMGSILENTFQGTLSMPENPDHSTSINISSNTLFHFTNSIENLLNILTNEFSPHYCLEYSIFRSWAPDGPSLKPDVIIPMVSFCDLPLFLIKSHLELYGSYGIGLSKTWGMEKGITPVYYVHEKSPFMEILHATISLGHQEGLNKIYNAAARMLDYAKPYEGPAWRKGHRFTNIRFYNEREWRFVPKGREMTILSAEDVYEKGFSTKVQNANKELSREVKITFGPDDIQYIIVRSESEILDMIARIEAIKSKFSWEQVRRLITTITTSERIRQDF